MVDGIKKRKSAGTYVAKNAKSSPMHCKINKKLQNSVERKTKVVNYSTVSAELWIRNRILIRIGTVFRSFMDPHM